MGTGRRISLLDLVNAINEVLGTELRPEFQAPRAGDVRDSQASLDRIEAVLGYEPTVDFEEGLRRTLARAVTLRGGEGDLGPAESAPGRPGVRMG